MRLNGLSRGRRLHFSLIEVMIVLAIIGIGASVMMSFFGRPSVIYDYLKSQDVSGRLESVSSAMPAGVLVGGVPGTAVIQASIVIKQNDGTLATFSTDDRQWAAFAGDAAKGKYTTARIHPYAPWEFGKAGTYHNGRLLLIKEGG